jgi:predicted 2-oxoglutarate/Fe(II)-dependent dioxygenase YbiX
MITYIDSFIKKETIHELQDFLYKSDSWMNLRKSGTPPFMLELGHDEHIIARQMVSGSMSIGKELMIEQIATMCSGYKLPKLNCSYINFFKYETGASLGIHSDVRPDGEIPDGTNFCSIVFYINDDYNGGLFRAYSENSDLHNFEVKPSAGSVILMPNTIKHESTEITNGNKYIAVMHWFDRGA